MPICPNPTSSEAACHEWHQTSFGIGHRLGRERSRFQPLGQVPHYPEARPRARQSSRLGQVGYSTDQEYPFWAGNHLLENRSKNVDVNGVPIVASKLGY